MILPPTRKSLRAEAERCTRLAKACLTPSLSKSLTTLAAGYLERARKLGSPKTMLRHPCPKCGTTMLLQSDLRTFECPKCEHTEDRVIKYA